MPPHRRESATTVASRGSGSSTGPRREGNAVITQRPLAPAVAADLDEILRQREAVEEKLAELDERVYDLESVYLTECVELGGSLFDGYGVERSSFLGSGASFFFASPTVASPSGGSTLTGATAAAAAAAASSSSPSGGSGGSAFTNFPGSPSTTAGAQAGIYGVGGTGRSAGMTSGSMTETSALAFRARTQNFTPTERIFSSTSIGAIGRVEQAKAIAAARGTAGSSGAQRFTATAGRSGGGGATAAVSATSSGGGSWVPKRGTGVMTRRRQRGEEEEAEEEDGVPASGRGARRRTSR